MKAKLLVFGITLMATSLMQAAIYKVTNTSNETINIDFKEVSKKNAPVSLLERMNPKETVSVNKGDKNIDTFVIFYPRSGVRYEVKNPALQATKNDVVNIQVDNDGYCTIQRGKQLTKVRGTIKAHFMNY